MGITASYHLNINNISQDYMLYIDKMWEVLLFTLTGKSFDTGVDTKNPLTWAIIGISEEELESEYISYIEKDRIKDIVLALDNFDIVSALDDFNMKKYKEANVYPDIWDYEEDKEEIIEDIENYFELLKEFYHKVLDSNGDVTISIS